MSPIPQVSPPEALRVTELDLSGGPLLVLSYPLHDSLGLERLSECEAAAVLLARTGISNREIARIRATSVRTVANQLASAYRKLGGASRACLKARAAACMEGAP